MVTGDLVSWPPFGFYLLCLFRKRQYTFSQFLKETKTFFIEFIYLLDYILDFIHPSITMQLKKNKNKKLHNTVQLCSSLLSPLACKPCFLRRLPVHCFSLAISTALAGSKNENKPCLKSGWLAVHLACPLRRLQASLHL